MYNVNSIIYIYIKYCCPDIITYTIPVITYGNWNYIANPFKYKNFNFKHYYFKGRYLSTYYYCTPRDYVGIGIYIVIPTIYCLISFCLFKLIGRSIFGWSILGISKYIIIYKNKCWFICQSVINRLTTESFTLTSWGLQSTAGGLPARKYILLA